MVTALVRLTAIALVLLMLSTPARGEDPTPEPPTPEPPTPEPPTPQPPTPEPPTPSTEATTEGETTTATIAPTTTVAPTCAPAPLYSNLNSSTCTAIDLCVSARCVCQYGANSTASVSAFGQCVSTTNETLTAASNCTVVNSCLAVLFPCIHRAAQEDGACSGLQSVRDAIAKLDNNASLYNNSDLQQTCAAEGCALIGQTSSSCATDTKTTTDLCRLPLFNRATLLFRGSAWATVLSTSRSRLIAALINALREQLFVKNVEIRDSDVKIATSRRAAGDLSVTFTVPADEIRATTTFAIVIQALSAGNTEWLSSIKDLYVEGGGSADDVVVASVINTTPILGSTTTTTGVVVTTAVTATTTTGVVVTTTAPATTTVVTTAKVGGSASILSTAFLVVATFLFTAFV